jgi:hypothetical protein
MSRLSLILTIVGLLIAILILVSGYLVPDLVPDRGNGGGGGDEGFPSGLHGKVPQYEAHRTNDPRNCSVPDIYTNYCYYVITEAVDERQQALIVEDIIRDDNIEASSDDMVSVTFYTPALDNSTGAAYAFRDEYIAKKYLSAPDRRRATVIDGVYLNPYY